MKPAPATTSPRPAAAAVAALESARDHFGEYYLAINPSFSYVPYQQELIVPALEEVESGDNDRLIVLLHPGASKTRLCTAGFAPWILGRRPDREVLIISYGDKPASEFGQTVRDQLQSDVHHLIFPWCKLKSDTRARSYFQTTHGGKIYTAGWGGAIARIRADFVLIDDPLKSYEEATSPAIMESRMRMFDSVVTDRLKPGGRIIIVTNRWAPRDVVGQILQKDADRWKVIDLKAEPVPGSPQARYLEPGTKFLWEKHFGRGKYEDKKRDQWAWQTTYQQDPANAVETRFLKEWLRYTTDRVNPGRFHTCLIVDPAMAKHKKADRTCIMVLAAGPMITKADGSKLGQIMLVGLVLDRLDPDERTRAIIKLADRWEADFVLYEETGYSSDTFYLDRDIDIYGLNCPIISVGRKGPTHLFSKEKRINMLFTDFREGRIVLPDQLFYKPKNALGFENYMRPDGRVDLIDYFLNEEYLPWAGQDSIPHDEILDCLARIHESEFGSLEFEETPPPKGTDDEEQREGGQFEGRASGRAGWFGRF